MTHKMSFCLKAIQTLNDHDLNALTEAIEAYARQGVDMRQAERLAVADLLAGVKAERAELVDLLKAQHPDLFTVSNGAPEQGGSPVTREGGTKYTGDYEADLFGHPIGPGSTGREDRDSRSAAARVSRDTRAKSALRDTSAPDGQYNARTVIGKSTKRELGSRLINTPGQAAAATRYLYRSAVERLDGIVTDAKGKPLAVIGNFKGGLAQASVYPATLAAEAVRIPGAAKIWFSHNHPSGDSSLSRADTLLFSTLKGVFSGSGIEPMGMLAVGNGEYSFHNDVDDGEEHGRIIPEGDEQITVPVIERELGGANTGPVITKPFMAKNFALKYYEEAKAPGMLLLDSQHRISAWVPVAPEMRGPLRGSGGLNAIYRAISHANAGAVILVHGGEFDQRGLFEERTITLGQNIAAALGKMDVRVLDSINATTNESAAEHGLLLSAGPVYSLSASSSHTGAVGEDSHAAAPTVRDVRDYLDRIVPTWRGLGLGDIHVLQSPLELPNDILMHATSGLTGAEAMKNLQKIEGVAHKGKVYLVVENLPTMEAVETALFHEAFGHLGVGAVLGSRTPKTLASLWDKLGGEAGIKKMAQAATLAPGMSVWDGLQPYVKDLDGVPDGTARRATLVDEFLALMAQRNDQSEMEGFKVYLSDLKASLAAFARKLGLTKVAALLERMTAIDVAAFVHAARKAITEGTTKDGERFQVVHRGDMAPAFSLKRGVPAETMSVAADTTATEGDNVSYERTTNQQANALASEIERRIAAVRPGFVLRAVEAPRSRSDLRAARALARGIFKHQVIFVEQPEGRVFNGLTFDGKEGGYVALDVRSKKPALAVLGHELLHRLKATKPQAYDLLNARLSALIKKESAYGRQLNQNLANRGVGTLDKAGIREELIADIVGDEFTQSAFWQAMAEEEPSTFKRIASAVLSFLEDVLAKVAKARPFGTEQYLKDIKAARAAVVKAMSQMGSRAEQGDRGDVKLSVDPVAVSALQKAGLGKPQSLANRVRDVLGSAMDLLRDRQRLAIEFQQGALDQFTGIKQAVQREIGNLPIEQDPYITARLANGGTSSVMTGLLLHGKAKWADNHQHLEKVEDSKGLLDILKPLGDDLNNWFGWMVGNRAARLMAEGRENNFTADEVKALQALNKGKEDLFRQTAKDYADFKRSVLDVAEGAGLLDKDARAVWDHADYIPFYRQIDERASFSPTGRKGLAGQSSGVRTLKGGAAALNDPMENLLMNFSRLIDASLKNNALLRTVDTLGESENLVLEKVGYDMTGALVPAAQIRKVLLDNGLPDQILDMMPPEVFDGMAKMWSIKAPSDPDVIRVMRDGKPEFYRVHDPLLLKALTSFVPFDFIGMGMARAFKRVLTSAVTATPEFMLRNFVRDAVASQMIARDGFNPTGALKGMVNSYTESESSVAQMFAGASFQSGNINAADPSATAKAMRRALRARGLKGETLNGFLSSVLDPVLVGWEKYREIGEAIESANRDMVYNAALANSKSITAAAFEAKDLMDFSLRGSSPVYQVLADVLPFFNARVQGMYRLGRTDKRRLLAYGAMVMGMSLLLAAANDGQDWYDELPDWDKDGFWHVKVAGKHFRIPKPFELGVVFATIPERIGRYIKGLDAGSKTTERLWANIRDQLAFDVVPQIFRPAINAWANKDTFRDSPIEGMADEGKLPHMRYSANTSATAKALLEETAPATDALGLSPKKLEYLVNGYFGTVGSYVMGLSDFAVKKMSGQPPGPASRLDDLPVVKAFYREDPSRGTVFESDLYKMREKAEQVYRSVNAARKDGQQAEAKEMEAKDRALLQARGTLNDAARTLASLNKRRDQILQSKTMTPEDKRTELDNLQRIRNRIAKQAMTSSVARAAQ